MSIEIIIRCDARGCCTSREISTAEECDIESVNFHTHEGFHYCPWCWPEVEKEIVKHLMEDNE